MSFKKGVHYEKQAEWLLTQSGLTFIDRHVHSRFGEIDLIFKEAQTLVFIEVRYRKTHQFGQSAETVNIKKQHKIIQTALFWMNDQQINSEMQSFRFDIFAFDSMGYEWIKNAFSE